MATKQIQKCKMFKESNLGMNLYSKNYLISVSCEEISCILATIVFILCRNRMSREKVTLIFHLIHISFEVSSLCQE